MAVTFGFYNSINKDRAYNANQFSQIFDGVIRDGVYQGFPENKIDPDDKYYLKTRTGSGMQVILGPGRAWFDGTWTLNDADMPITISGSDYQADRIDTIVLKTDKTDAVRMNSIYVEEGTPSDNPVPKDLDPLETDSIHFHPLATIRVRAGTDRIGPDDITIQVNNDPRTPFVTGILEHVTAGEFLELWAQEWDEYKVRKRNEYETWVSTQEDDFLAWSSSQRAAIVNWENEHKDAFELWESGVMADFAAWMASREEEFQEWFDHLHYILDGDVAGHLENEIEELDEREFRHFYEICNKNTRFYRNDKGIVIRITSESDEGDVTSEITFETSDRTKIIRETVTVRHIVYSKTTTFNMDTYEITEVYERRGGTT